MEVSPSSRGHTLRTCFINEARDGCCSLEQFIIWMGASHPDGSEEDIFIEPTCPMARCRRQFSSRAAMLLHLQRCNELRSTEYWCPKCFMLESFEHKGCHRCPSGAGEEQSFAAVAREVFDSVGCGTTSQLVTNSANSMTSHHALKRYDPTSAYYTSCGEKYGAQVADRTGPPLRHSMDEPSLVLDPDLNAAPPLTRPRDSLEVPTPGGSILLGSDAKSSARSRSRSPFIATTRSRSARAIPSWKHQSADGYRSESTDSWDDIAPSDCSDNLFSRDDPASVATPLPDELPTPKGISSARLRPPIPGKLKTSDSDEIMQAGFDDGTFLTKTCTIAAFMDEQPSPYQPRFCQEDGLIIQLPIDANLAFTEDIDIPFDMQTFLPQDQIVQTDNRWRESPQALVRATWSRLQIHLESSLQKLGLTHQSPLAAQFSSMSQAEMVNRGLCASVEIMGGRECNSPLGLISYVHLSYAMSLVLSIDLDQERSRELFAQAMAYSDWVQVQDRQAYINMVDALWRPSHMALTEVVGLLQGTLSGLATNSRVQGGARFGSREDDPIARIFEVVLDEFEHAVLQCSTDSHCRASDIYCRHLKDLEMQVHRGQPFVMATTMLLRALSHQFSDIPRIAEGFADMLNRVNAAHVAGARRIELEALILGRLHLPPNRFLNQYVPLIRSHVDSLYARNSAPDAQRLSYWRDSSMLMGSLFRNLAQDARNSGDSSFNAGIATALDPQDNFLSPMSSSDGGFNFHSDAGAYPATDTPYTRLVVRPGGGSEPKADVVVGRASSSSAALSPSSPSGSYPASSNSADPSGGPKIESDTTCSLCGYRPKGDPRWFGGSMAKHMKLQHATTPPKIYRCPFPGCTSQFQKRPDNLRQHQIEKGHFVDAQEEGSKRISKRKKG